MRSTFTMSMPMPRTDMPADPRVERGMYRNEALPARGDSEAHGPRRRAEPRIEHAHPRVGDAGVARIPVGPAAEPGLAAERPVVVVERVDLGVRVSGDRGQAVAAEVEQVTHLQ